MKKLKKHNFAHHQKFQPNAGGDAIYKEAILNDEPAKPEKFPIDTREIKKDLRRILILDTIFLLLFLALYYATRGVDFVAKLKH